MKKFLTLIACLVCCLFFTGCIASYVPEGSGGGSSTDNPSGNGNSVFTVRLSCDGEAYIPETPLGAQWYNGERLIAADFVDGVATAYGLDGDYQVTLSDLPDGYTYNPNNNFATNRKKDVTIELLPLTGYMGAGTGWGSNACQFTKTGTYAVTFKEAGQTIRCNFMPSENGSYVFESIMDTVANEVNPRLEYFGQNTAGWTPSTAYEVYNDGGVCAAYTRNFKYTGDIDGDCINFTLRCNSRVDYPVKVYFTITYASYYSRNPVYEMVEPKEIYDAQGNLIMSPAASGTYIKCGRESGNTNHLLNGSKFALGSDGYYHYKDGDVLTSSIVYADMSTFAGNTGGSGNGTVTVSSHLRIGLYDYTLFINGWSGIVAIYGTESNVPEKYQKYKGMSGYMSTVVNGRMCAVNEELRGFLQAYSAGRQLFFDGLGSAEQAGYNSSDDDQWLYFCGYYI